MKKPILKISLAIFLLTSLVVLAQTVVDVNSSVGNGNATKQNMNEPHVINPCKDNIQGHEVRGVVTKKNVHPETNLGSDYTRKSFE
jgi:hypothetical protein